MINDTSKYPRKKIFSFSSSLFPTYMYSVQSTGYRSLHMYALCGLEVTYLHGREITQKSYFGPHEYIVFIWSPKTRGKTICTSIKLL